MAVILPIAGVNTHGLLRHWWQWVLIAIIGVGFILGASRILLACIRRAWKLVKGYSQSSAVPKTLISHLQVLDRTTVPFGAKREGKSTKPTSFGPYLGSFANPPTEAQVLLLSQWELIILDPFQPGVLDAVKCLPGRAVSPHLVGRLQLDKILQESAASEKRSINQSFDAIISTVKTSFRASHSQQSNFTGILLAGWEGQFTISIFHQLTQFLATLGFAIYLEISPPIFLADGKILDNESIAGVVIRNGTILPNGERRDYFQMTSMKNAVKAFVSQSCYRQFVVMLCELHDDSIKPSNAVVKRSFNWCNFYSAISWIGTTTALYDAAICKPVQEPLGAFSWLKDSRVMRIQDAWRTNSKIQSIHDRRIYSTLDKLIPNLDPIFALIADDIQSHPQEAQEIKDIISCTIPQWAPRLGLVRGNPLSMSPSGEEYRSLGCFPLGEDVSSLEFAEVQASQQHLKKLGLLSEVPEATLQEIGRKLQDFVKSTTTRTDWPSFENSLSNVHQLSQSLLQASDDPNSPLQVYIGLESGFRTALDSRFWAVYDVRSNLALDIHISKDVEDFEGVLIHAYLSSCGCARHECFATELAFAEWSGTLVSSRGVSKRMNQDIHRLSPEENILFLQHLTEAHAEDVDLTLTAIRSFCREQLIDRPNLTRLKELNTIGYLDGSVSVENLISTRIAWYRQSTNRYPDLRVSITLFKEVETVFTEVLRQCREDDLLIITQTLDSICEIDSIDAVADLVLLSFFCAARKLAFEEVYVEVTDRNPLFNDQPDQAAAFAELFTLGARCEAYFDVSPSALGNVLAAKYRSFYGRKENQPPSWVDGAPGPASAYAAAGIDIDSDTKPTVVPTFRRFGFLSVFAIPALVDILLLTLTGRGLYLSAFMSHDEQLSATLALMISLLLSGAIGTWISCGGTYYIMSMAFSAMNLFVLTRLIGGIAFTIAGGILGFILLGIIRGFTAGIVFFLYLVALTSYFCLLAALANFEYPGSSYISGRVIIICCVPILFISPMITFWVPNHDTAIYLSILYIFVVFLVLGARRVGSRWMTWYQKIPQIDDATIRDWYISAVAQGDREALSGMTEPAALRLARAALYDRVRLEKSRNPFTRATSDALVLKLAKSFDGMIFLLDWYCRYSDVTRPIPYSSAWNIQIKVALDTLRQAQHGIRLHNAFIHWRQAGDEVGCGILYFLVALLDKWVELLTGDPPVGLSSDTHSRFRMAVGLGLAYYLTGALLLEFSAQSLHHVVDNANNVAVRSADLVNQAVVNATLAKRRLYWTTLAKYLAVHIWSLTFTGTLMWVLDGSSEGVAMFVAYVGAYTGLLWYQYSKIFSGPHALKPLLMATAAALPVGIILKKTLPLFAYDSVIALALGTWLAAILSFQTIKLGTPKEFLELQSSHGNKYHAYDPPGSDLDWSQEELKIRYDALCKLPAVDRFEVKPSDSHGMRIKAALSKTLSSLSGRNATELSRCVKATSWAFEDGSVHVELVPSDSIWGGKEHSRALSHSQGGIIHLLVEADNGALDLWSNCRIISEVLLHAVSEGLLHLPHSHSLILESLIIYEKEECEDLPNTISWSLERQFRDEPTSARALAMIQYAKTQLITQLCLGIRCNTQWHQLPSEVREILLHRCLGKGSQISKSQLEELHAVLADESTHSAEYMACCNFGVSCAIDLIIYSRAFMKVPVADRQDWISSPRRSKRASQHVPHRYEPAAMTIKSPFRTAYHMLGAWIKFFVIALVADPEFQRELDFVLRSKPGLISKPVKFLLSSIWVYSKFAQDVTLPLFMFHGRDGVAKLWGAAKGTTTTIKGRSIVIENLQGVSTAFIREECDSGFKAYQYGGRLKQEPETKALLQRVYTYSKDLQLRQREDWNQQILTNKYEYEYEHQAHSRRERLSKCHTNKIPSARRCTSGPKMLELLYYTRKGLVESGSYMKDGNVVRFKYHYSYANELLRAEYVLPHITCNVSWCASPPRRAEDVQRWIPHSKVLNATFVQEADVWESTWTYHHKFHPDITTILNGRKADTPPMIQYDWLNVLEKPGACDFEKDNPLLLFQNPLRTRTIARWLGSSTRCSPISTTQARSQLWKAWKKGTEIDGVTVRWLDEKLLRKARILHKYWRYRDTNNLVSAANYLDLHVDAIMATVDLDNEISSWTPLALKLIDLHSFGQGGDAVLQTRAHSLQSDGPNALHVMAVDTGTWPNEGGGVSACRRDMVNNLESIKWHMVAESANDFGVPKHQIERNVESLKVVPLWGLDFLTPTHGIFQNRLDSEVHPRKAASNDDIRKNFLPILTALVKGARAIEIRHADVKQVTRALVNLNTYFEDYRNWNAVWTSDLVKRTWRDLWLTQDMANAKPSSDWLDTELPTITSLNTALELWFRYLFIFSIPIPENIPTIFQASHHSVSASYGIVCKIKRGVTLQIWDHAISWRETNLYLSSALCTLPPFVRNSLLGLMRVTSVLTLHHADNILPCADFFNPGWEIEIGTCQGTLESRNTFRRKVDPIVNGIPDMQKFAPITEIKSVLPTVTMLSHVWYAKDIKTALLAADIIVHNWGFKDFRLNIYGALDKAPTYSAECQEILACKSLRENVNLCGTADPGTVLANTWVFLNSSISEGLPLALGEAALTGAPVVCTDVGASLRVLTDPKDGSRYSEVVAPNDAHSLARAQINLLALLGEWSKYAEDPEGSQVPILTDHPTEAEVASITNRMYEKGKQRRNLGMMARTIVQQSFRGDRYLREHEQMLWIGKATNEMRENPMQPVEIASTESSRPVSVPTDYFSVAPVPRESRSIAYSSRTSYSALSVPAMTDSWGSYPASVDFKSIVTPKTNSLLGTPRPLFRSRPSSGLSNLRHSSRDSYYPDLEANTSNSSTYQSDIVHLARPMDLKRTAPTFTNLPITEFEGGHSRSSSQASTPGEVPQAAIPIVEISMAERTGLVAGNAPLSKSAAAGKEAMNSRSFAARIAAQRATSPGWD